MADETSFLGLLSFGDQGWGDELLRGAWLTIQISICSYLVGMVLGLLGAGAKLSHSRVLRWIADIYTTIVRAVPELLLIILIYYTGTSALKQLLVIDRPRRRGRCQPLRRGRCGAWLHRWRLHDGGLPRRHPCRAKGADGSRPRLWHVRDDAFSPYPLPAADALCAAGPEQSLAGDDQGQLARSASSGTTSCSSPASRRPHRRATTCSSMR